MKGEKLYFRILLRGPKYPVLVIDDEDIIAAFNIKELGTACYLSTPPENANNVSVVDCTGEEFLYLPEQTALVPWIAGKRWTKKKLIDLFNNSDTAKKENMHYPSRSLSNKRWSDIFREICNMLGDGN